jgi:molybdenum cofactor cytidylyltransferase
MISAIVLAAGFSTRMGRAKSELRLGPDGRTFEATIRETLAEAGIEIIRVVVPPSRAPGCPDVVVNPDPGEGMLSSIQCGLRSLPEGVAATLVWPVDHPLVRTDTVFAVIEGFATSGAPMVIPTFKGRRGHPVLFASRVFSEIHGADPSIGARAVVHAHADRYELVVDDRGVIVDIDSPADYARVLGGTT